ncbi:uncharacterized protein LOC127734651 [Mytilus californianus]|uniref:uncharacterized protein LOC127734651 n=1 Tax=Mytilus californianus TaxID=6549 RepID=UPI0022461BE3|nr:uncharacterized protein LOC127734651 [Mytilus californianus]
MSLTISDMVETLKNAMQDLQLTQNRVKERTNVKHIKAGLSNEIKGLEGIEERLANFENISCRDSSQLQAILGTAEKLSVKLDIVSIAFKNRTSTSKPTELNKQRLTSDTYSNQIEPNQAKKETITSCEQNVKEIHGKGQKSCSKFQNDVAPEKVTDMHRRSQIEDNVSKVVILKQEKQPKIIQFINGFKHCRTDDDLDNRMCYKRKKCCFQGEMLHPLIATTENQNHEEPTPNITIYYLNERRQNKTNVRSSERPRGIMTLAQNAVRDFDSRQKVHSYEEWFEIAKQSHMEVGMKLALSNGKRSSRGHNYMLLLDTSESMHGEKFDTMIKTATNFIDGLHQVSLRIGIRDNVGLAHFGKDTELITHPIAEYDDIKREIAKLRPGGPSPLAAGMLMALSGIHNCGPTTLENHEFLPYIIVITDGIPTSVDATSEADRDSIGMMEESSIPDLLNMLQFASEIGKIVQHIAHRGTKIFCVPIGAANTDIMSMVVKKTFGKFIPPDQIQRLTQNTQVLLHSSIIANQLETTSEINRSTVKTAVRSASSPSLQELDAYDDITDNIMLLLDPVTQYHGRFKQPNCQAVQLGTRVRRGPDWQWQNQDSEMAGTVIGEDKRGKIRVEWDSGNENIYRYDETNECYDIEPVNEPRRLENELIAVGCRVKRGKDWKYGEQDGGRGSRGTILCVESNGKVVVHWDRRRLGTYKFACDGLFEVAVCEDGRMIGSPDLIDNEENSRQEMVSELPLILPTHTNKMKPVKSTWQYQNASGNWESYDEETNVKIERAYIRKTNGKCIVEINKTLHVVLFSKMIQENQTDHSSVPVQRLDKTTDLTATEAKQLNDIQF